MPVAVTAVAVMAVAVMAAPDRSTARRLTACPPKAWKWGAQSHATHMNASRPRSRRDPILFL